jgi:RNA 3'-terminal phosphate cyclase-like protein
MSSSPPPLRFTTHHSLSSRLILSTLLGRTIHISAIRPDSPTNPGLAPHEISLLRLIEAITNGSHIEISYTGTVLLYKPGLITGSTPGSGANARGEIRHEISAQNTRGLSYFLIPICLLAPFSKAKFNILFTGLGVITSSTTHDISVDTVRTAILPLYAQFGIEREIELRILKRSNPGPNNVGGAGEVQLLFGHQIRLPKTLHFLTPGRIKSIRGVAYSTGVSGSNNARTIDAARGILNKFCADIYIFSDTSPASLAPAPTKADPSAKKKIGLGFGLSLVAESTSKALFSADAATTADGGVPAEEIGKSAAYQLLESIQRGGCISVEAASTVFTLMAMGSEDVGRVCVGKEVVGSENVVQLARDLNVFGAAGWGFREAGDGEKSDEVVVSVVGRGVGNVGRKIG